MLSKDPRPSRFLFRLARPTFPAGKSERAPSERTNDPISGDVDELRRESAVSSRDDEKSLRDPSPGIAAILARRSVCEISDRLRMHENADRLSSVYKR